MRVERANNPGQERQQANEQLLALFQAKLISQEIFAKYYNKATLNQIGAAIREYSMVLIEQQRQQEKLQQAQAQKDEQAAKATMGLANLQNDANNFQIQNQQKQDALSYGEAKLMEGLLTNSDAEKSLQ